MFLYPFEKEPFKSLGLTSIIYKSPSTRTGFESEVSLFIHISCFFLKRGKDSFNYVKLISCLHTSHTLLDSYRLCGDHQKAIDIWKENTLPVYNDQLGDHPWTASILSHIAVSYKALAAGNPERDYISQAEKYFREAQGLRERLLGHHQDTARSCVQLSDVLVLQGQFDKALGELNKALVIQNDLLGPDHKITKNTVSKMSDVMDKRGSNPR